MFTCANCEIAIDSPNNWFIDAKLTNFCDTCFSAFKWGWNAREDRVARIQGRQEVIERLRRIALASYELVEAGVISGGKHRQYLAGVERQLLDAGLEWDDIKLKLDDIK